MTCLIKTIEAEIIPRLMAVHLETASGLGGPRITLVRPEEVNDFTDTVISSETSRCLDYIESIRSRGVPLSSIYLDLLAPAARRLGAMWTADTCDFTQITVALWRMQQVMYDLSPSFQASTFHATESPKTIMLTPVPGSQHTLGILMVGEFFRRAGWDVRGEPAITRDRLLHDIHHQSFDMVGISVGSEPQLRDLDALIHDLRQASMNPSLAVMVGGPVFSHQPELLQHIGADATAIDAQSAVAQAEALVAAQRRPSSQVTKVQRVG